MDTNYVEDIISGIEMQIKSELPKINRVFIEVQSWLGHRRFMRDL
jgi:hypothetical protein